MRELGLGVNGVEYVTGLTPRQFYALATQAQLLQAGDDAVKLGMSRHELMKKIKEKDEVKNTKLNSAERSLMNRSFMRDENVKVVAGVRDGC